jgi:hypothetical protein
VCGKDGVAPSSQPYVPENEKMLQLKQQEDVDVKKKHMVASRLTATTTSNIN